MAEFEIDFAENILDELLSQDAEAICEEMLSEAAPVLEDSMKKAARSAVMHEGESEMVESIAASKVKKTKDGDAYIVTVGPRGYSSHTFNSKNKKAKYKVSNAMKALWKEYGIAGKQAPKPFLAAATNNAEKKALEKMKAVYEKKTGGGA